MHRLQKNINKIKYRRGMTYVELIVVLSIFSVLSAVVMFSYRSFQDRIDIKNLASDIGLQILEAQKGALSGRWSTLAPACSDPLDPSTCWKPAYGVYFNTAVDNKSFIYFADTNIKNDNIFQGSACTGECLNNNVIGKGNYISSINATGTGSCSGLTSLTIVFTRPDSNAAISNPGGTCTSITSVDINVFSPQGLTSFVRIFNFGKIRIP